MGDNLDLTITQDGENNQIGAFGNITNKATHYSDDATVSYSQTGDNNKLQLYTVDIGATSQSSTQTGNNNNAVIDCHGDTCSMEITQNGDSNTAHAEVGTSYLHNHNSISINQQGDSNNSYAETNGDSNSIDSDQLSDNNFSRVVISGNNNAVKSWQGKHSDGSYDNEEEGDHEVYWTVTGNSNNLASYQTDTNRSSGGSGHHIANVVDGNYNEVTHTQKGKAGHDGFVEIDGDSNTVDLYQRGNGGQQWADIVLNGNGHTVDATQRGTMGHDLDLNLTNNGGAYTITSGQTTNNTTTSKTYTLSGSCGNANGCSVTVNQN